MKLLSHVQLMATRWTAAYQAPPSMGFSRQEYWSGVPSPSPMELLRTLNEITNIKCLGKYLVYGKPSINISFYYCYYCYINERLLFSFYIENYSIIVSLSYQITDGYFKILY